jgi:hypothetical protein
MTSRRRIVATAALAAAVPLSAAGWTVHLGLGARDHLQATRAALEQVRAMVVERRFEQVPPVLDEARRHAAEAARLTSGPTWWLLTHVPFVGDEARTVQGLAGGAAELTAVLTDVAQAGTPFLAGRSSSLYDARDLLSGLRAAAPVLDDAVARLARTDARLAATPERTGVDAIDQARQTVLRAVGELRDGLAAAATTAAVLPPMLGLDGPRRYFLAFQTNAEARGTGGLVGAFGVLKADGGKIGITRLSANNALPPSPRPVVDFGQDYRSRYGEGPLRVLSVSNLSPHFPYAARTWTALWQRQKGERLDGAIALDPVGLSHLLRLVGPVTVPGGQRVTSENVVDLTERVAYDRYTDPAERKRFLIAVAEAVDRALTRASTDPLKALPVLTAMTKERRLQVWSRHAAEQRHLSAVPLGGTLTTEPGPYAGLVVNNSAGGKLDYYLNRSLDYDIGPCREGTRSSSVRVRLTNDVPTGRLPTYVTGRLDSPGRPQEPGSNLTWISLYAAVGAKLRGAWVDGEPAQVIMQTERSHPVFSIVLEFAPRQSRTVRLDLTEPVSVRPPVVPEQPLVRPQQTRITQDTRGCPAQNR